MKRILAGINYLSREEERKLREEFEDKSGKLKASADPANAAQPYEMRFVQCCAYSLI